MSDTPRTDAAELGKQCRNDGRCQYAIDHGAEGLGHCPEGRCVMPTPEPITPDADAVVDEYADEYEYDEDESGYHIPTDKERILLADFGHGLVSLLHERGLLVPKLLESEDCRMIERELRERIVELEAALGGMLAIVNDSRGVAGYHLNGDVAEWDEFEEVGLAEVVAARSQP